MESNIKPFENELAELKGWDEKYGKFFDKSVIDSRANLRDKLARYENLEARFDSLNFKAPALLREQRRQIERRLYPNIAIRTLFRLVKKVFSDNNFAYEKQLRRNYKQAHARVQASGFSIDERHIEKQVRRGNREFTIPVSYYVTEKEKMDYEVKLSRDATGGYQVRGYHARYQSLGADGLTRQSSFNMEDTADITARQAFNLLAGRAICIENSQGAKQWQQLDFNDKDAAGNFRPKVFPEGYGFDLSKSLSELGLSESLNYATRSALMESLHQGEKVKVTTEKGKEMEIEANPHKQRLNIYEKGILKNGTENHKGTKAGFAETRQAAMKVVKPAKVKGI